MATDQTERTFEDDLDWCYTVVQDVSRTFALTVAELDEPMARDICVGYLLCRVADTIEDATHIPPAEQSELLACYGRVLDPEDEMSVETFRADVDEWIPDDPNDDWQVVEQSPRVVRTFRHLPERSREAMRPPVLELVDGMGMFVERYADEGGLRLQTIDELEEYCWYAAGTVGTLVTSLLVDDVDRGVRETLRENARSFALLLQLVNVAKDVAVDYEEENNVYLPRELLADHGLSPDCIGNGENGESFSPAIRQVVDRAEGYLDGAQAWLGAMPETRGNTLSAWAIPYLLAVGTMRELKERPADVIEEGDVKVTREEVGALLATFAAESDPSVADLRARIESQPLNEY